MERLHDPANVQQTSSKYIKNTRANAGRLLDLVSETAGDENFNFQPLSRYVLNALRRCDSIPCIDRSTAFATGNISCARRICMKLRIEISCKETCACFLYKFHDCVSPA